VRLGPQQLPAGGRNATSQLKLVMKNGDLKFSKSGRDQEMACWEGHGKAQNSPRKDLWKIRNCQNLAHLGEENRRIGLSRQKSGSPADEEIFKKNSKTGVAGARSLLPRNEKKDGERGRNKKTLKKKKHQKKGGRLAERRCVKKLPFLPRP